MVRDLVASDSPSSYGLVLLAFYRLLPCGCFKWCISMLVLSLSYHSRKSEPPSLEAMS